MAKTRGGLALIFSLIGGLFALSGLVFTLQGIGVVGPQSSFMFKSTAWIHDGVTILVVGLVLILAAVAIRPKAKPPEAVASTEERAN